jgi:Family of unknown function (DUF5996)
MKKVDPKMAEPSPGNRGDAWPALPVADWKDTCATVHMWTQIVGKVRLALTPLINHWWNVTLYLTARGLTTSPISYRDRRFELCFDFLEDQLVLQLSDGSRRTIPLAARPVAEFYRDVMSMLASEGIAVNIWPMPCEVPDPIPFDQDRVHASYSPEAARKFWRILLSVERVFEEFRSRFVGKCSPIHFFWGSFDLAVTRFSGRNAPARPGADRITQEAYSQEVSSVGFWPGGGSVPDPAFYSYTAPEPAGFRDWAVRPEAARYDAPLGEFILMYDQVRNASSPADALLAFCQTTYEAGATLGRWNRNLLERQITPALGNSA